MTGEKKPPGWPAVFGGVRFALFQLRALASPAASRGENQKYAKKNRGARITGGM
jgi:hypothetical protein